MHPRQAGKIIALQSIGHGADDYRTFSAAASFGHLDKDDFQRIEGYQHGLEWVQSNSSNPNAYAKDHKLSRRWAFDNHFEIGTMLGIKMVCALMAHAAKYDLGDMPKANQALWLMAVVTGHPANAQAMTVKQNSRKGAACSISLEQLKKNIVQWEIAS